MKFSIGDKIVIRRTGEEGHVTAYVNKQMIEIEVGGTIFPVYIEDIDHPYLKWFTDKTAKKKKTSLPEQLPVEKAAERKQRLAKGVYLSFLPEFKMMDMDEVADVIKVYLLNEMPVNIRYAYDVRFAHESEFSHEGTLHAFGNVYLHSISYADMNDQPRFHWQLSDAVNKEMQLEEGILRIRPQKLFEHINKILQGGEPTFNYLLIDDLREKKVAEPQEKYVPPVKMPPMFTTNNIAAARHEIDLHIEALLDDIKGLSNAEIIRIQLETLQHYLQLSIVHRQERMIVIHGLGKGKLREEVHTILKRTPEVVRYKNEWSSKYGFGATEITFRYR